MSVMIGEFISLHRVDFLWFMWRLCFICSAFLKKQNIRLNGFPGVSMVKNPPAIQALVPWVRKIPWRRAWQPASVFLPGESHGQRSLAGYSPWSHRKLPTTKHTCTSVFISSAATVFDWQLLHFIITKEWQWINILFIKETLRLSFWRKTYLKAMVCYWSNISV